MLTQLDIKQHQIKVLLFKWLNKRVTADGLAWLDRKTAEVANNAAERTLFTSFSAVPRYLGKEKLNLSVAELQEAQEFIAGWIPIDWNCDDVGRTILLLSFPHPDSVHYVATIDKIVASADVREAIAFYQSLSLLPYPEQFQLRAAEGIRTNMTAVFNAVALNNPYPAKYLDDLAWNQMVLKALFVGTSLNAIYGLNMRNNQQLSQMLIDYARERLAANRTVSPQLWELAMPFLPQAVKELQTRSLTIAS